MPDGSQLSSTPTARRARRYRARKRDGALCFAGEEIDCDVWERMVRFGWIGADEVFDPARLSDALVDLADFWVRGTLTIRVIGIADAE